MSTIILHKGELTITVQHEDEILDFILYNIALGNSKTKLKYKNRNKFELKNGMQW